MPEIRNHITVLMPVYNDAKYIRSSIKSILHQTYKNFQFLIIDDGSSDNTEEIVHSFKDSRINYKKNLHYGLSKALNFGLKNAYGDWIARIDADDVNTPNRLYEQISYINTNSEHDVISSWSVYFKDPNKILFFLNFPHEDKQIKRILDLHNPINHSSVIFNKKRILDLGGYNEDFKCYEDFELWLRIRDKVKFHISPKYLVYTRLRKNSLTQTQGKNDIYKLLIQNAVKNISNINFKEEKVYWENILFWIEYFFGDKKKTGHYLSKEASPKEALAYLTSFFPYHIFENILNFRLRYRLQSLFKNEKKFKEELNSLLNS